MIRKIQRIWKSTVLKMQKSNCVLGFRSPVVSWWRPEMKMGLLVYGEKKRREKRYFYDRGEVAFFHETIRGKIHGKGEEKQWRRLNLQKTIEEKSQLYNSQCLMV